MHSVTGRWLNSSIYRHFGVGAMLLAMAGCTEGARSPTPRFSVETVGLELPQLDGWVQDPAVELGDPVKGGTAMRLVRESTVTGSPRVDVVLDPVGPRPTQLKTYVTRNLREMAALETGGKLRILSVTQKPVHVGQRSAVKVRHEYTLGEGASQVAITQVSLMMVVDGRGVTVVAAGRTELFHPLADSVERILAGVTTHPPKGGTRPPRKSKSPGQKNQTTDKVEPVDLGKIGGN